MAGKTSDVRSGRSGIACLGNRLLERHPCAARVLDVVRRFEALTRPDIKCS
jgi:hypothetical protein